MINRFALAAILGAGLLSAAVNSTAPAHADPYCDATNQNYNYVLCTDEPQNNPSCWGGDTAQCMKDWRHVATEPSPPGES